MNYQVKKNNKKFHSVFCIGIILITLFFVCLVSYAYEPVDLGTTVSDDEVKVKYDMISTESDIQVYTSHRASASETFPKHFYDADGNELENTIVYYDGELYAWDGKQLIVNEMIHEKEYGGTTKEFFSDENGKIIDLTGLCNIYDGKITFLDYIDSQIDFLKSVHGREYLMDAFGTIHRNTFVYHNKSNFQRKMSGVSDENGFKIKKQGNYIRDDQFIYLDRDGKMPREGLYSYHDETFYIKEGVKVCWTMDNDEINAFTKRFGKADIENEDSFIIESEGELYLDKKAIGENSRVFYDIGENKKYLYKDEQNKRIIVKENGFVKIGDYNYFLFDDCSLAFDEIVNYNGKDYLFDEGGDLVLNNIYMLSNGDMYLTNEEGCVIDVPGLYRIERYNKDYVINDESRTKLCFVGEDGKVIYNDFIFFDDKVYFAKEDGTLLRNSALANRYYFNENYELTTDNINVDNVKEAKKWVWYCDIKGVKYKQVVKLNIPERGKRTFNRIYIPYNKRKNRRDISESAALSQFIDDKIYDENGKIIKNRFVDIYVDKNSDFSRRYYVDKNGIIVRNCIVDIGGEDYMFDERGCLVNSGIHNFFTKEYTDLYFTKEFAVDADGIVIKDKLNYSLTNLSDDKDGIKHKNIIVLNNDKDYVIKDVVSFVKPSNDGNMKNGKSILGINIMRYDFNTDHRYDVNVTDWQYKLNIKNDSSLNYSVPSISYYAICKGKYYENSKSEDVLVSVMYDYISENQFIFRIYTYDDKGGGLCKNQFNHAYPLIVTAPNGKKYEVQNREGKNDFVLLWDYMTYNSGDYYFEYENKEKDFGFEFMLNADSFGNLRNLGEKYIDNY